VEECLAYFRDAIHRPGTVPSWAEWWAVNEPLVREHFPRIEYLRLKVRGVPAAEDYLRRTGQLLDPIRLDPAFIDLLGAISWLGDCGKPLPGRTDVIVATSGQEAVAVALRPESVAWREWHAIEGFNQVGATARARHVRWNDRVRAVNDWLDASGLQAVWAERLLAVEAGPELLPVIRSDVVFAWLAHEHRDPAGDLTHHERLFSWYRNGRLVCGWSGAGPVGMLVVF
jgi:hypothetical protein